LGAGLIQSQRGLHGGSVLALSPDKLSVYDVIEAVQPIQRIRCCPLSLTTHGMNLCPLHRRLDDAMAVVQRTFRETMIADLLTEATTSKPLCESVEPAANRGSSGGKRNGKTAAVPTAPLKQRLTSRSAQRGSDDTFVSK
jgi:DNA-binding IscR family transcriptional regulator